MVVNRLFNQFARHEGLQFIRTWRAFVNDDKTPNIELFAKDGLHLSAKGTARLKTFLEGNMTRLGKYNSR